MTKPRESPKQRPLEMPSPAQAAELTDIQYAVKNRQSFYLSQVIHDELHAEARRLQRSVSWVMQRAWRLARNRLRLTPRKPAAPRL